MSDISSAQSLEGCFLAQDVEFSVYVSQAFEKTTNSSCQPTHMKWCELRKVTELLLSLTVVALLLSFPVVSDSFEPMGYTVHGILQARILEWVAFPFSRESSQPRDRTQVSHFAGRFFTS